MSEDGDVKKGEAPAKKSLKYWMVGDYDWKYLCMPQVCARVRVFVCACAHTHWQGAHSRTGVVGSAAAAGHGRAHHAGRQPCLPLHSTHCTPRVLPKATVALHSAEPGDVECASLGCPTHTHTQGTCPCTGAPPDSVRLCAPPAPLQWPWCTGGKKRQPPKFFGRDAFLGILTAAVMGLQHAMAMLAGLTTVPYLIGNNAYNVSGACRCLGILCFTGRRT